MSNDLIDEKSVKPIGVNLGFHHSNASVGRDTIETLCDKVDAAGGWNPKAACVQFYHGIEDRHCVFADIDINTGYWTTVLTRDEYYWHRISPRKKALIRKDIVEGIRRQIA